MLTLSWLFIIRAQWLLKACSKHQGRHTFPLIDKSLAFESQLESEIGNTGFCPVGWGGGGLHKMETLGTGHSLQFTMGVCHHEPVPDKER